jgi:hypothetical protein
VEAAERRVNELEQRAAKAGTINPGPVTAPCQSGVQTSGRSGAIAVRDSSANTVTCSADALQQQEARRIQAELEPARAALEKARRALDGLEEEARRAGALPGWLR